MAMDLSPLIDTHCHFDFPPFFGNEHSALAKAEQAGVTALIVPSVSVKSFAPVTTLAQTYANVYAALGLHPIAIAQHTDQDLACLADYLASPPVRYVALGEIGLDNMIEAPQLPQQRRVLQAQLGLAKQYDLPVLLHSRRTHALLLQMLKQTKLASTGVIHAFAGSKEEALSFIKLGYFIGVGGTITYPRANKTRHAIAAIPLTSIVLETDAPDMPIAGYQGQPNRPERLKQIVTTLATLRPEPIDVIVSQIYQNTLQLFPALSDPR